MYSKTMGGFYAPFYKPPIIFRLLLGLYEHAPFYRGFQNILHGYSDNTPYSRSFLKFLYQVLFS